MVYDYEKEKWFYCERKDFDKIENKLHQADDFCFETYNKVVGEFSKRYRKCYDKNHINFNGTVNRRYTPKKVWKNFEKYA